MPLREKTRIFTFWEPRARMPAYLRLCLRTWERHVERYEVVVLDHGSVPALLHDGDLDLGALSRFSLSIQKDAIMVAVLGRHGGVFMDVDTLMTRPIDPYVEALDQSEVVQIGQHLAFMAVRPNARLLEAWLAGVRRRLAAARPDTAPNVRWDHLGNSLLSDAMDHLIASDREKPALLAAYDHGLERLARAARGEGLLPRAARRVWSSLGYRRRMARFREGHRAHYRSFDRAAGFIAELDHFEGSGLGPLGSYRRFWFEPTLPVEAALGRGSPLIALHHSWTPPWYSALSEDEVLSHPSLLSRTLAALLGKTGS